MSVGSVTGVSPDAGRGRRRSVSIYDRLEDARERRASVLGRQPAIPPRAATPKARPDHPEPTPLPEPEVAPAMAASVPVAEASPHDATRWTIRGLAALLFILVFMAIYTATGAPPRQAPDFAPPVVSLTPQAYGAPLLATIPRGEESGPTATEPRRLSGAVTGGIASVDPSAIAPKGPALQESVEGPAAPAANPGSLITLPAGLRPAERPALASLAQGGT